MGAAVVGRGEEVRERMVERRRRVGNCMIAFGSGRGDAGYSFLLDEEHGSEDAA